MLSIIPPHNERVHGKRVIGEAFRRAATRTEIVRRITPEAEHLLHLAEGPPNNHANSKP